MNRFASFSSETGSATVSGTAICTDEPKFATMETSLAQQVGRFTIRGIGFADMPCDGTPRPWSVEVSPTTASSQAASVTFAFACGPFDCGTDFEERTVQLRGKS